MAINLDDIKKLHEELLEGPSGGFSNNFLQIPFATDEKPNTTVRLLPGKDDETPFYVKTMIHRLQGAGKDGNDANFHCRKVHGDECPLCDLYFGTWKWVNDNIPTAEQKEHPHAKYANYIRAKDRYYINVLDRETDEVKILSVGIKLFTKIVGAFTDEDFGDITDLQTGHDFKIIKTKNGNWPDYSNSSARPKETPTSPTKKRIAEVMDSLHDLAALVKTYEYDEIKKVAMMNNPVATAEREAPELLTDETEGDEKFKDRMENLDA